MNLEYSCFISYRRNDDEIRFIRNLKKIVQGEVFKVTNKQRAFLDNDEIRYGEHFDEKIYASLETSFFFISVWYFNYLHEDNLWCARELYHALQIEACIKECLSEADRANYYHVIPLVHRGANSDLPDCMSRKNAVPIKLLETDIVNNRTTARLTKFKVQLYDALHSYYQTLVTNAGKVDFNKVFNNIKRLTDEELRTWVSEQRKKAIENEATKLPVLTIK